MDEKFSKFEEDENCIQHFSRKNLKGRDDSGDLGVERRAVFSW
jgi:hypothetical protein